MPTWSNAGSLPPGSLPRNISAKSSAIAIFGPSPSFLEENENPTPTPRRWRNMKLSRSQPSTKLGTPSDGDGRNFSLTDLGAPDGAYHYADILLSRSTNGGVTWSPGLRVNADPLAHLVGTTSRGTDHYMPGVAVDKTGAVGVCWYDRRSDSLNLASGRFCSISRDGGNTWLSNFFVNGNWAPWHAMDSFINSLNLGDYD